MAIVKEKNILSGPEEMLPVPEESLGTHLLHNIRRHGDKIAQVMCHESVHAVSGESATYADILTRSLSVAEALRLRGFKRGDVIGICSENNLEFCLPVLGALYLGATCAPLNPAYTTRELIHCLSISKPRLVFCSSLTAARVAEVSRQVDFLREVVVFGAAGSHDHIPFSSFLRNTCPDVTSLDAGNEGVAAIMCSSGTTGLPKGVMLTDKNILTIIGHRRDPRFSEYHPDDVVLAILPFFHAYGYVSTISTLCMGLQIVVLPKFEEKSFLSSIEKYKVTVLTLVPPLLVFLGKHPLVDKYDLSSIRSIYSGAAPLGEEIQTLVKKRIKVNHVRQGYGLTETTLGVLQTPQHMNKHGSSGKLAPGTQCKVVDLKTGLAVGPNVSGELCFRGPLMMKGYVGDLQATSACMDDQGFLHTGDIGYYDQDEFFFIVDRLKELIKYKAFQVPPAELEAILLTHPSIKDTAVIGVPDEDAGELPLAFVVLQPGKHLTKEEVMKFVADQVSPQKRLHGGVRFVESIPKTPSGKILRRDLRDSLKSKL